jgi:hypothetical protein
LHYCRQQALGDIATCTLPLNPSSSALKPNKFRISHTSLSGIARGVSLYLGFIGGMTWQKATPQIPAAESRAWSMKEVPITCLQRDLYRHEIAKNKLNPIEELSLEHHNRGAKALFEGIYNGSMRIFHKFGRAAKVLKISIYQL